SPKEPLESKGAQRSNQAEHHDSQRPRTTGHRKALPRFRPVFQGFREVLAELLRIRFGGLRSANSPCWGSLTRVKSGVMTFLSLLAVLIAVCPASAQDEARALLDKAAKAHGGKDKLAGIRGFRVTCKGTMELAGLSVKYTQESTVDFSGKV